MIKKNETILRFLIILGSILLIIGAGGVYFVYRLSESHAPGGKLDFSLLLKENVLSHESPVSPNAARVFFTNDGRALSAEFFPLPSDLTPYQKTQRLMNRLIMGPSSKYFEPTIPPNVKILGIFMEDNNVTLDFSGELKTNLQGGVTQELLTIYSIVNTLILNVDGIERVQILVDGKIAPLLSSEIDLEKPFMMNLNLIRH